VPCRSKYDESLIHHSQRSRTPIFRDDLETLKRIRKVVRTNGRDEVIARSANLLVGRAAFEKAAALYPKACIEYRSGAKVIERRGQG
jgi:hypothetical protein